MKGSLRLTVRVGPKGEVLAVSPAVSNLSATVASCATARVSAIQLSPPMEGSARVVIVATFFPN